MIAMAITVLPYLLIEDGKVIGRIVAPDNATRPVDMAIEWRNKHRPKALLAVILGGEENYEYIPIIEVL